MPSPVHGSGPKFHFHEPEPVAKPKSAVEKLVEKYEKISASKPEDHSPKAVKNAKVQDPLQGYKEGPGNAARSIAQKALIDKNKNRDNLDELGKIGRKDPESKEKTADETRREASLRSAAYRKAGGSSQEESRIESDAQRVKFNAQEQINNLEPRQRLDLFQAWGTPRFSELQKELHLENWSSEMLRQPLEKALNEKLSSRPGAFPPPGRPPRA